MSTEEDFFLELLGKYLEGTLSLDERKTLMNLVESDPDKMFLFRYLGDTQDDRSARLDAEVVYERTVPNDLHPNTAIQRKGSTSKKIIEKYGFIAIAATLILLFSLFLAINTFYSSPEEEQGWEQMVTKKGERKFIRMSDGTEVWLNSETSLQVKKGYGKKHREMKLEGEAYFSVAKNEHLPLHVYALDAEIEVLGTVFNVRAYPEEQKTATSLIEGKVKLYVNRETGRNDYTLNPGDKVEIPNSYFQKHNKSGDLENSAMLTGSVKDVVEYKKLDTEKKEALDLLWIENKLVFNGDPLETMVKKMERWYDRTIVIENENLKEERFTGIFEEKICEEVLDVLQKTGVKFTYRVEDGIIYIK